MELTSTKKIIIEIRQIEHENESSQESPNTGSWYSESKGWSRHL